MVHNKVTIIGAGSVGSTIAYTLMLSTLVDEIVLLDINREKAEGEVMDFKHCIPALSPVKVYAGNYSDCMGSKMIIITAGVAQKPNESRLNLAQRNTEIFESIIENIRPYCKNSVILVVTNPVDILTYVTMKLLNTEPCKVIGSGTVLDTARFRYVLSEYFKVDPRDINAYIIGEHGDNSVPVWSSISVSGVDVKNFPVEYRQINNNRQKLHEEVINSAYRIIEKKGATYYAIAVAVRSIIEAILRNQNTLLMVSSLMDGQQYGITDVCLSLPTIVNSFGVKKVLNIELNQEEIIKLHNSASVLKRIISKLDYTGSRRREYFYMEQELQLLNA